MEMEQQDYKKGRAGKALVRRLCFMAFGASALANPLDLFNVYNLAFGALVGLVFGGLFRVTLKIFLSLFNIAFRKEQGKEAINFIVDNGMLFLSPFALMLLLATFYLRWSMNAPFISAGIMAVGTASAIETGKLQGKKAIKNTIATSAVSFLYSLVWTQIFPILYKAPPLIEGGLSFVLSLVGGGKF